MVSTGCIGEEGSNNPALRIEELNIYASGIAAKTRLLTKVSIWFGLLVNSTFVSYV